MLCFLGHKVHYIVHKTLRPILLFFLFCECLWFLLSIILYFFVYLFII